MRCPKLICGASNSYNLFSKLRHYEFYSDFNKLNPLNLSILISGGEENNSDILSSGERKGLSTPGNCALCNLSRTKLIA